MITRQRLQLLLALSLALVFSAGCTKHIVLTTREHAIVQHEPIHGAVHPYPGISYTPKREGGPFIAVFFSTAADLEAKAKKWTHHLYFKLLPCSQEAHDYDLYSGRVFVATEDEREKVLGTSKVLDQNLFKIHIPLDLQEIKRAASIYGTLDVPSYFETARQDGLCFRVGGGQMWGVAMFSNIVHAPLALRGDSMVVVDGPPHRK